MIHHGDCIEVMRGMEAESVDAVVTDPPYGLEFMGKGWDRPWKGSGVGSLAAGFNGPLGKEPWEGRPIYTGDTNPRCLNCGKLRQGGKDKPWTCVCDSPSFRNTTLPRMLAFQAWCTEWASEALRVTKPGGYLLAFGGTRTHHRLVCGLEDAGWIIRDELDWIYASGFPKGKANLKPAHEPIVLARKPGPLQALNIDGTRIGHASKADAALHKANSEPWTQWERGGSILEEAKGMNTPGRIAPMPDTAKGRWPSNLLLSDPELFDSPNPYVVGSGATTQSRASDYDWGDSGNDNPTRIAHNIKSGVHFEDGGGYSRFFIIPKADRADREPTLRPEGHEAGKRFTSHPTVKPTDLMRHLIRLVTPPGGLVLDPFAGSGSTGVAATLEGFVFILIEKEAEYIAQIEARLNGVQRGLGLDTPLVGEPRKSVDGVAVNRNRPADKSSYEASSYEIRLGPGPDVTYRKAKPPKIEIPPPPGMFDEEPAA